MRIFDAFRTRFSKQKEKPPEQNNRLEYETDEAYLAAVRDVRQTMLDIMNNGVVGSDLPIPQEAGLKAAVFLPILLRYDKARAHFKVLQQIILNLEEQTITKASDYPRGIPKEVLRQSSATLYFRSVPSPKAVVGIAGHVVSPYANGLWQSENIPKTRPTLHVEFLGENLTADVERNQTWKMMYRYKCQSTGLDTSNEIEFATRSTVFGDLSLIYSNPPRVLLNNFLFSAVPLEAHPEYIATTIANEIDQRFITIVEPDKQQANERFHNMSFSYDVEAAIDWYKQSGIPGIEEKIEYVQRQKEQLRTTTIVNIGTTEIRGQKHYIYTAAEKPLVKQESQQKVPSASPALSSFGQLSPEQRRV